MYLLSANGALRTILILLIIWQLIRLFMQLQQRKDGPATAPRGRDGRKRGDMRIEQIKEIKHGGAPDHAEDADFEEIK